MIVGRNPLDWDQRVSLLLIFGFIFFAISIKYFIASNTVLPIYQLDSIAQDAVRVSQSEKYNEREPISFNSYSKKYDSPKMFEFDPNLLSEDSLRLLNVNRYAIENLIKYRRKGGKFRSLNDVRKIYGMEKEIIELQKYLRFGDVTIKKDIVIWAEKGKQDTIFEKKSELVSLQDNTRKDTFVSMPRLNKLAEKKSIKVNAVTDYYPLMEIDGVGKYYAEIIFKYKERLGGFLNKQQLYEITQIPHDRMDRIAEQIIIDIENVKKLDINTASKYEIGRHPYLDFKKAGIILLYRQNHYGIKNLADYRNIGIFTEEEITKISPYLKF